MQFIHLTGLSAVFFASIVSAQSPAISQSEGTVFVQDKPLLQPATLPDGSVVRTAEASRVEIRLRGGVLHVGANSSVRILENRPYNFNRFEVLSGSVVLSTDRDGSASAVCENAIQFSESWKGQHHQPSGLSVKTAFCSGASRIPRLINPACQPSWRRRASKVLKRRNPFVPVVTPSHLPSPLRPSQRAFSPTQISRNTSLGTASQTPAFIPPAGSCTYPMRRRSRETETAWYFPSSRIKDRRE